MTVLELQLALQEMPPNMEVAVVSQPTGVSVFKIEFVSEVEVFSPDDDETQYVGLMVDPSFPPMSDN